MAAEHEVVAAAHAAQRREAHAQRLPGAVRRRREAAAVAAGVRVGQDGRHEARDAQQAPERDRRAEARHDAKAGVGHL